MFKTIITITLPFASYSRSAHVFSALLGFSLPLSPSPHCPSPSVFIHIHSSRQRMYYSSVYQAIEYLGLVSYILIVIRLRSVCV